MGLAGFNDGGLSKDLGWCAKLTLRASKMPVKILLLMPPYLAQRLEIFPGGHEVKEWWLDDAWSFQVKHELSLSSLLDVEKLWSVLVRPLCQEMVENGLGRADVDQKRFAVELLSEALKRAMPLLNPDDAARVMAVQRLAERKIELGSLRSLVKAVACSSARHVACRFWPWLQRCMSEFSATAAGREILLRSIRMASLSFMSKLQPVGDLQQVLLECPKRSPDVSVLQQDVVFPFTEELLSVIGRVAERSWGTVAVNDLVQTLSRVWPDLLLPQNDLENARILHSCLAQKLPGHSLLVPQQYLESIRNLTSNEGALFAICSELPLLKALSFIGDEVGEVGATVEDGAQVLLKACQASNYCLCEESLLALREASRCVSHQELSRVAAVWWALVQLSNQDLESAWQDAWALIDDVSMPQNVSIPIKIPLVMGLVQLRPERAKRLFPVLVQSHPEGAAFLLARALQDPPSPNDARDQLGRLTFWLNSALGDAAWSPEYLESSQAKFACSLLSFWLKGMNLEKWLQSFSETNLFDSEAAETLSVLAFAFHVLPRVAQNWNESVAISTASQAFQRMAEVTGLRRPLQNYFVRLLAYHHGENLAPLATSLETLGDWIYPFIRPPPSEADREVVRQLMFLPNFKELLEVSPNWHEALLEVMQVELKEVALEQMKQLVKSVASLACVEELGPLRSAAVIWFFLISQDPSSAFHLSYFGPDRVKTYLLPLQQPNEIDHISDGTRKYRCSGCGEPYFIGNCGQAMQASNCPACGHQIGGQSHRLLNANDANIQQRQVGMAYQTWLQFRYIKYTLVTLLKSSSLISFTVSIHFVPTLALAREVFGMGRFEEGSNYAVNGFDAHMYRLVQILLLLPLAILQPQGKYQDDLQNNLKALCRQLEIQNGQGALLLAKVFHLFGRELLLAGLRFSSNPEHAKKAEDKLRAVLRQRIASSDFLRKLLQEAEAQLESAGESLLPIEQLRDSEVSKLDGTERRDEFASEVLHLPGKDVWSKWQDLRDEEKQSLPIAGFFSGDWKQSAETLQKLPGLVLGWCHLHRCVHQGDQTARQAPLFHCMDETVMQNFVEAWNLLVHKRVGYECQQDLQLVEISPHSEAEVALVEDGSMGRALFMTLVKLHNGLLKQISPSSQDSRPVELFQERERTATVLLNLFDLHDVRESFVACYGRSSDCWQRCEEVLAAALKLQGPRPLADSWPPLSVVKDKEVVQVKYNQLDSSKVEAFLHDVVEGRGQEVLRDELKKPKLLADMLSWCQRLALCGEEHIARDHPLLELLALPEEAKEAEELLQKLNLQWQHLEGFQRFLASMLVTSPCSRVDPQLKQPLRDDLLRQLESATRSLAPRHRCELSQALKMVSDAVNYKQKDQKLHDWLVGVDLDEETLGVVPEEALLANLGAVLELVHRLDVEMEDDMELSDEEMQ